MARPAKGCPIICRRGDRPKMPRATIAVAEGDQAIHEFTGVVNGPVTQSIPFQHCSSYKILTFAYHLVDTVFLRHNPK